jgi:hypothetical protein
MHPHPFHYIYHHIYEVVLYAPPERADTIHPPSPFLLYPYMYSVGEDADGFGPQSTYIGRDETGLLYLPTQLERTLQLYW